MWKPVYDLFTQLFTVTQRLNRHDEEIRDLRRELKALSDLVDRLLFEQMRTSDELKRLAEREADARKIWQLQIENQLLKSGRQLPPAADAPTSLPAASTEITQTETTRMKAQMEELLAALQRAEAQRAHDQAEIAQLKAQMAALLAELQKKVS